MKRRICFLLALALVCFALAACKGKANAGADKKDQKSSDISSSQSKTENSSGESAKSETDSKGSQAVMPDGTKITIDNGTDKNSSPSSENKSTEDKKDSGSSSSSEEKPASKEDYYSDIL